MNKKPNTTAVSAVKHPGRHTSYTGIDHFRFVAALLIVAIHTSPLGSFTETGDFILTRVTARIAVPFFLMTSGFFMISRWTKNSDKLKDFIKKTAFIYLVSILIYVPINIYNGYFRSEQLMPKIIKDIIFDGTLYHLWYLPAAITGAVIAWNLVRKFDYPKAFAISVILYIIGLFGDSYYGISKNIVFVNGFYDLIFQVCDYTRNGIFFAPVFMILGGFIADSRRKLPLVQSILGFIACFSLMCFEALILHHFQIQRHDSMYIFLIPSMYFLFGAVLHFRGKRLVWLRTASLAIYVIHPMVIVAIRLFAKIVHLESLFIDNSLIHFLLTAVLSTVSGIAFAAVLNRFMPARAKSAGKTDRAYIEINLKNLEHNAKVLQNAMPPGCRLMAVVKTEAYGHGAFEIASHLNKIGVTAFAAATADEGIALRKYGIRGKLLILGHTPASRAAELKKYDLIQTVTDFDHAEALNKSGIRIDVHIKADTGMHRLGVPCEDIFAIEDIFAMKNLNVCGIYTHLCCSESLDPQDEAFTNSQINSFYRMINELENDGIEIPCIHIQSSYGLLNYPDLECDYVRAGVALYGVLSSPDDKTRLDLDLRPVLSLKAKISLIRYVSRGESVGYDRSFTAERNTRVAILPIGYGDGFPRSLSCGRGHVMINNEIFPVIGRISMDSLAVDITENEDITAGDMAVLIGYDRYNELYAPVVADSSGSISNELLCRMGSRLPVITV